MTPLKVLLIVALCCFMASGKYIEPDHDIPDVLKTTPFRASKDILPTNFDWSNQDGTNYLTTSFNQHIPIYCGSCWAHAASSALSDRIKILRKAAFPDVNISPQHLISCDETSSNMGCEGGSHLMAYKFLHDNGAVDRTCSIYQARGWTNGLGCEQETVCWNCNHSGCFKPDSFYQYQVTEYGKVVGEDDMMSEVFSRGPIACSIDATEALHHYKGGILNTPGSKVTNHVVSIVGWGEENGVPFWRVRNSWGTWWGEQGYFRIIRGVDSLGLEGNCSWAVPDTQFHRVSNMTNNNTLQGSHILESLSLADNNNFLAYGVDASSNISLLTSWDELKTETPVKQEVDNMHRGCLTSMEYENGERVISPRPHEYTNPGDLPANFWWGNVNGVNYLSWTKNQHIPVYCGSCWAQSATSTLADRFNIHNNAKFPNLGLSVQALINCQGGGSCFGGNSGKVFEFAYTHGIPDNTCKQYVAKNPEEFSCSAEQVCMTCNPPPPKAGETLSENCYAIENPPLYKASEYGSVYGVEEMKTELFVRGPISCSMDATANFEKYTGGIYSEYIENPVLNHSVAVVGWGTESSSGEEFWIVRNSWGTYWGELGYFRVPVGKPDYNLGIETHCHWAMPDLSSVPQ